MTEKQALRRIEHAIACAHGEFYGEIRDEDGKPLESNDIARTAWEEVKRIARQELAENPKFW